MKFFVESRKGKVFQGITTGGLMFKFRVKNPEKYEYLLLEAFTDREVIDIPCEDFEYLKRINSNGKN